VLLLSRNRLTNDAEELNHKSAKQGRPHNWANRGVRLVIGLGPLDEHIPWIRDDVAGSNEMPPTDWAKRQWEMLVWARSVGWQTGPRIRPA
jgi:hypothetical protein